MGLKRLSILERMRQLWPLWVESDYGLSVLGVIIGIATGCGAVIFSALIDLAREFYFGHVGGALVRSGLWLLLLPLLPMTGALLVGLITWKFAPEAEGHGVPEVMDAMARKGARIRPRVAGAKAVASALTIGSGGSAGTEGPIIQIGAAIGSGFGQWLRMSPSDLRVLISCGAAAGIASIFNAPIAGVLFAVEVLLRDISLRNFLAIILASVSSSVLTQAVRGASDPLFPVPHEVVGGGSVYVFSVTEIGNYAVLGLVCGLVALAFVKALYFSEDLFRKLPVHRVWRPVIGAALLGFVALAANGLIDTQMPAKPVNPEQHPTTAPTTHAEQPPVMGNGYPVIGLCLDPPAYDAVGSTTAWTIRVLLILLVAKILATCLTLGSGGSGGVFAPSLFIGATTGGAFGILMQSLGWYTDVTPGAYALVGMAAVVAASIHAPLTAGIMLFELTGDYEVILPIMLSGVIALGIAQYLEPASIYTLKLLRRGIDMHRGQDISLLRHLKVRDQMRPNPVTVRPGTGLMDVISKLVQHPGFSIFVVDDDGRFRGVITANQCRTFLVDLPSFGTFIIAQDLMQEVGFPAVGPNDSLADVMRRLARYRGEVPVVENGRLLGAIWPEDVIERYNNELFKRDMASSMATQVTHAYEPAPIPVLDNHSIAEIRVPWRFVGQSLGSLDVRQRYDATILLIKKRSDGSTEPTNAVPSANYVFQAGDIMLVMAPDEQLRRIEHGEL